MSEKKEKVRGGREKGKTEQKIYYKRHSAYV